MMAAPVNTSIVNAQFIKALNLTPDSNQQSRLNDLIALTPKGWYGDAALAFGGVYYGFLLTAALELGLFQDEISYVKSQTRISTSTGGFLDLTSQDFLGTSLPRIPGESDSSFRTRIIAAILRERATRNGILIALNLLGAPAMVMCEPWFTMDCGGYAQMNSSTGTLASGAGNFPAWGGPSGTFTAYTQDVRNQEIINANETIPNGVTIYTPPTVEIVGATVEVQGTLIIGGAQNGSYQVTLPAFPGYGSWGRIDLPYQAQIQILRPINKQRGPDILGYGVGGFTPLSPNGYMDRIDDPWWIQDEAIEAALQVAKCFGTAIWVAISNYDIRQRANAYAPATILGG